MRYAEVYGGTVVVTDANADVVASSSDDVQVDEPAVAAAVDQALSGSGTPQPRTVWPWVDDQIVLGSPVGRDAQVLGAVVLEVPTDAAAARRRDPARAAGAGRAGGAGAHRGRGGRAVRALDPAAGARPRRGGAAAGRGQPGDPGAGAGRAAGAAAPGPVVQPDGRQRRDLPGPAARPDRGRLPPARQPADRPAAAAGEPAGHRGLDGRGARRGRPGPRGGGPAELDRRLAARPQPGRRHPGRGGAAGRGRPGPAPGGDVGAGVRPAVGGPARRR